MVIDKQARPFELLPAIDLRGGRAVRLLRGDFAAETAYADDPVAVAVAFVRAGARWLHVVDLDGARDPSARQVALVESIVRAVGDLGAVEVAGGLRDEGAVASMLHAGAARAIVGTAALRNPDLVAGLIARFGPARVGIALDVRDGLAVGHGWIPGSGGVPVVDALTRLWEAGARIFEVTAIDRDGTLAGPDLGLLGALVARGRGDIIASAGIASAADVRAARDAGCAGAIVGRAIYEGRLSLAEALAAAEGRALE